MARQTLNSETPLLPAPDFWAILLFAAMAYFPFLGNVYLFDWDEVNFAEAAREMLETGNYLQVTINYLPFWEKPPFFFWLQALSMQVFGIGEFAARLPNAIANTLMLFLLHSFGRQLGGLSLGRLWALAWAGTILPHFYSKSAIIDPWFNLFIFLSIRRFILSFTRIKPFSDYGWGGFWAGMAVLTKGPVALGLIGICLIVFWAINRFHWVFYTGAIFWSFLVFALTLATWLLPEYLTHGTWFFEKFWEYTLRLGGTADSGHGGFIGYHFVVLLIGCFPSSVFAMLYLWKRPNEEPANARPLSFFRLWMRILFWVVLVVFSLVKTKIVHYSSLCYLPLTFLAADWLNQKIENQETIKTKGLKVLFWFLVAIISIAPLVLPILVFFPQTLAPLFSKDPFAKATLFAQAGWTGLESLVGIGFLAAIIYFGRSVFSKAVTFRSVAVMFLITAGLMQGIFFFFIKKIDRHTQAAYMEFLETLQGRDVYVVSGGFKTYAPYFYARIKPQNLPLREKPDDWRDYLLTATIAKPVFVVAKIQEEEKLNKLYPNLKELYRKNGFIFYQKQVPTGKAPPLVEYELQ